MSRCGDYFNKMLTHRLSPRPRHLDAAFEAALGGGDTDGERGEVVESVVKAVRSSLELPPPEPNAEFAVLLEHGLAASEMRGTADDVPSPPLRVAGPSRPPGRRALGAAFAKVAALSLLAKLTLGGVAVAAAATGAGAAGMLPGPVQDAFDRVSTIVLGEPPHDEIAPDDAGRPDQGGSQVETEHGPVDRDVPDRTEGTDPANRRGDRSFGDDASDTTRPDSPNRTDNGPSGSQHHEQPAPTDPPATMPQDTADPPANTPHEPDEPATSVPEESPPPARP